MATLWPARARVLEDVAAFLAECSCPAYLVQMFGSAVVRAHAFVAGARGQENQALGRSRGGFSTKIHLKTDHDGHPVAFDLTGGEATDSPHFPTFLSLGPDVEPRAALAVTPKRKGSRTL
ncbi:MAG: hypothetical protein AAF668_14825 [Pseudomonadota bacterium]